MYQYQPHPLFAIDLPFTEVLKSGRSFEMALHQPILWLLWIADYIHLASGTGLNALIMNDQERIHGVSGAPALCPNFFFHAFHWPACIINPFCWKKTQMIHYLGFIEKFWGVKCEGGIFGRTGHSLEEPIVLLRTTKVTTIHPTVGRLRINIYT